MGQRVKRQKNRSAVKGVATKNSGSSGNKKKVKKRR